MKQRILLFIPMYNCQNQITRVLKQVDNTIQKYIDEIIIVNNRSTDDGERVVRDYFGQLFNSIPLQLLRNDENYGLGGSHKVAFQYALDNGFDYVIVLHGDDQGNIADIVPFLDENMNGECDCLLGARFHKDSKLKGYSRFRTFGNHVYNSLFTLVAKKRIYDLGSGLNLYRTSILKDKYYHKFPDNLTFNYCMILSSVFLNHKVKFFPISWREDDQVSNVKMVSQAIKVLKLLFKYAINKEKFMKSEHRERLVNHYSAKIIYESGESK